MTVRATVLFADVVGSRRDTEGSATRLRRLVARLDDEYRAERMAPFGFTQGDEVQGLLQPSADPLRSVMIAALDDDLPRLRWAIVVGEVDDGTGPATERTGSAFLVARGTIDRARTTRSGLIVRTGDPIVDGLADDLTPLLVELLERLTTRQRQIARLILLDGLRQADVARRLGLSRAAISIAVNRALIPSIGRLADAIRQCYAAGTGARWALAGASAAAVATSIDPSIDPHRQPDPTGAGR